MSELKTLKDLSYLNLIEGTNKAYRADRKYVIVQKLKQEAIKWYHRSDGNKHKFIKEFFNLSEENLENE